MDWKLLYYYFIVWLMIKNGEGVEINWNNPHFFTLLLILITFIILILNRINALEETGFRYRYMLIGMVMAFVLYYLEEYFLG
ncbi:hypothetical protein AC622_11570 [Bacillus sp. FJAT-27916]|nr:hypothetical protein AC622_11570 [Bacillus sp. FJAT-27916]